MKAKDFIIIGGAIALYYLYQKNKTKTSMTSTAEAQDEATPSGGGGSMPSGGGGGAMSMPSGGSGSMPSAVTPRPATPRPSTSNPISNKPENVFDVILPSGGTASGSQAVVTVNPVTPNPEIIVGGTRPVPAIVPTPIQTPEEVLISGGIAPIVRPNRTLSTSIS